MGKTGRNEPCPCGSGKKYKKCCLHNTPQTISPTPTTPSSPKVSLKQAIDEISLAAEDKQDKFHVMGVFIFFATKAGDAWLIEVSDMDVVQLAKAGKKIAVELDENPDTIMINWTHRLSMQGNSFTTTAYSDGMKEKHRGYPIKKINQAIKGIREKLTPEVIKELHVGSEEKSG